MAEDSIAGQVDITVLAHFQTFEVPYDIPVFARMREYEFGVGVLLHHAVHFVLAHRMQAHDHILLGRKIENLGKAVAGIVVPALHIRHQLADQPHAERIHPLDFRA